MIINHIFFKELFQGFHIQRWNDRIRPMDLIEIDKHSHKMMIAYVLAKYEEERENINWNRLILYGIFELLRRLAISDIKSPIYAQITKKPEVFKKLNEYVYKKYNSVFNSPELIKEFEKFLFDEQNYECIESNLLSAAHIYASIWEFKIIEFSNPNNYQIERIRKELDDRMDPFRELIGIKKLVEPYPVKHFVDLFGYLRFQYRWAHLPRIPRTSVLGHSLFVAIISYFFVRSQEACYKRLYNAFWGGLFHDLPETVTRDIISPVKTSSQEIDELIKAIEVDLSQKEIYPLVEQQWIDELKYFTINEFKNKIIIENEIRLLNSTSDINEKFNDDIFNPYDGQLIRSADHLAAFMEAWHSCKSGIKNDELIQAMKKIRLQYQDTKLGVIDFNEFYNNFEEIV